jgi:hypothetical protein
MIDWVRTVVVLVAVVLLERGCWPRPSRDVITPWLTCIDCPNGQLDSVKAAYARDTTGVGDALLQDAIRGPQGADSLWVWDDLTRAMRRDSVWIAQRPHLPPLTSPSQRAQMYFRAYRNTWRARATVALAVLKDPRACVVVDSLSAPADTASAMIRAALRMARDSLPGC